MVWTEDLLNDLLTTPSEGLVADVKRIRGDIMILGAGGKMGYTLAVLAKRAVEAAGVSKRVIAVSRFSDAYAKDYLLKQGVEIISCDLFDKEALLALPDVENIIYMAGRKFGTDGEDWRTWGMNATLPAFVAERFKGASFVVFSSGNVYSMAKLNGAPSPEEERVVPMGEYPMSVLARERVFEHAANTYGTKVLIFRLSYAIDLRYGVMYDMARNILEGNPIRISTPAFNCIWQGSANEYAIRSLLLAESPARILNVSGPETLYVKRCAMLLGKYLGKEPSFIGEEKDDAYVLDTLTAHELFGYPKYPAATLLKWQAEWLLAGGRVLDKPTHFEERGGSY